MVTLCEYAIVKGIGSHRKQTQGNSSNASPPYKDTAKGRIRNQAFTRYQIYPPLYLRLGLLTEETHIYVVSEPSGL